MVHRFFGSIEELIGAGLVAIGLIGEAGPYLGLFLLSGFAVSSPTFGTFALASWQVGLVVIIVGAVIFLAGWLTYGKRGGIARK